MCSTKPKPARVSAEELVKQLQHAAFVNSVTTSLEQQSGPPEITWAELDELSQLLDAAANCIAEMSRLTRPRRRKER